MGKAYEVDPETIGRILEAIPEIVIVIDREGKILYINRVEPGYDRDAVIGMQASAILAPESLAVFQTAHESVFATGGQEQYDAMVISPTGVSHWYRTRMLPLRRDGEIVATLLQSTNISDLKAAQEQIDRLRQLVPICSWCDRIEDGKGGWESLESYIERQADTKITHGVCPACFQREMDDLEDNSERGGTAA